MHNNTTLKNLTQKSYLFVPLSRTQAAVFNRQPDFLWWHKKRQPARHRRYPRRRLKKLSVAIALVGSTSHEQRPGATNATTYSPVAGNLIVVLVQSRDTTGGASTITGVTDNASGGSSSYSAAFNQTNYEGNQANGACFYCPSVKSGVTTITTALSNANVVSLVFVLEYSGLDSATPLDQATATAATATGTTATATSKTTTAPYELIVGLFLEHDNSGYTWSNSGSYTLRIQAVQTENGVPCGVSDRTVTTAGAYAAAATISTSSTYYAWMVTFKGIALIQNDYRWRRDDGSETTATWVDAQGHLIAYQKLTNLRIRILVDSSSDSPSTQYQLEFRRIGASTWSTTGELSISLSPNFADGDATTAQLTAPTGKTSGSDFQAGKMSDLSNPMAAINLASDKYTEVEFCIQANTGAVGSYEFRLTSNGTALDIYRTFPVLNIVNVISRKPATPMNHQRSVS